MWLRFFSLACLAVSAFADTAITLRTNTQGWRCHAGDDLRWARADFDDSGWAVCSANSLPPIGISWARIHVLLPQREACFHWFAGTVLQAASVLYANGTEIASLGRLGAQPDYRVQTYVIVLLPRFHNEGSADVVFARRMQNSAITRLVVAEFGLELGLELGPESLLKDQQENYKRRLLAENATGNVVEALLALLLGAYVLRLWSAERSHWEYFWFVAIAAFFTLRAAAYVIFDIAPMEVKWAWALATGFAAELLLPPFFWTLFHRRVPKAVVVYTAVILAVHLLGIPLVPDLAAQPWIWLANIPVMGLPLVVIFQEVGRGNREGKVLVLPMLFYGAALIWADLYMAGLTTVVSGGPDILAKLTRFTGLELRPVTLGGIEIAGAVFLLTTAVVLADRARRTNMEQARLSGEFAAAQQLQKLLVPPPSITVGQYQIESAYLPSEEVGGDFFQLIPSTDGSLLMILGDVSGKGLKAAMMVSLVVGALQRIRREGARPESVLNSLNEVLAGRTEGGFVTCCCARFDADGTLTIANAGHLAPYRNGKEIATPPGLPLGVDADARWTEMLVELEPGDRVLWVSDGVIEARNGKRDLLGFERARELAGQSAAEIVRAAQQFGQEDDITVVSVTRQPVAVYVA
jgi:hypothetical protein